MLKPLENVVKACAILVWHKFLLASAEEHRLTCFLIWGVMLRVVDRGHT
jgi:hypothetical protein